MTNIAQLPQWVAHRQKIPVNPHTGGAAKTNDSTTWADYETAVAAVHRDGLDGVGFVFTKEAGVTGIDLDKCMDEDGRLSDLAQDVVTLLDSYTEVSPSGRGLHILVKGSIPQSIKRPEIEIYGDGRYFTYTGNHLPGTPTTINSRQGQLDQLAARFSKNGHSAPTMAVPATLTLSDTELITRAQNVANGGKFSALWAGDIGGYPSHSEADAALCSLLAFWTGGDATAVDRLFRQSGLYRPKWDERHFSDGRTYGQATIAAAIAATSVRSANGAGPGMVVNQVAVTSGFKLDDTGNGERFVSQHGDKVRYVHTWGKWLVWNGRYWAEDETGQVDQLAKVTARSIYEEAAAAAGAGNDARAADLSKWARTSGSASKRAALLTLAQSEPPIAITHAVLNCDPYLVACTNGTIDLRTCQLRPSDPADLITRCLPVVYDPAASCPLWLAFLGRIMPDPDNRQFLQKMAGVGLSGVTVQALFFLYGAGANGKSTFVETMLHLWGEYAAKTSAETLLQQDRRGVPNDLAALVGKRLVVASELPDGRRLNESQVKDLTGGDSITARFLNQEFFTFHPEFKIWMYGNHKPVITGTDDGIWRRIRLIPFTVQIPDNEQDGQLTVKLRAELPGILAWAVQGWRLYQAEGLNPPAEVAQATAVYRAESDALGQFLDDCTIQGGNFTSGSGDLYQAYATWTGANGLGALSSVRFARALQERGFTKARGNRGMVWRDIGLLDEGTV